MARVSKGSKRRAEKKCEHERRTEIEKGFQMDEVHLHLTCHCSVLPMMTFNRETGIIQIPVSSTCPVCHIGTPIELIVGGIACETDGKCKHPDCTCQQVALQLPYDQFLYFLQKGREE